MKIKMSGDNFISIPASPSAYDAEQYYGVSFDEDYSITQNSQHYNFWLFPLQVEMGMNTPRLEFSELRIPAVCNISDTYYFGNWTRLDSYPFPTPLAITLATTPFQQEQILPPHVAVVEESAAATLPPTPPVSIHQQFLHATTGVATVIAAIPVLPTQQLARRSMAAVTAGAPAAWVAAAAKVAAATPPVQKQAAASRLTGPTTTPPVQEQAATARPTESAAGVGAVVESAAAVGAVGA
eukprot:CAMPEP_0113666372 /NCGR_PEP_ID=MMETSP0038_2-20120614/2837_1 /TAXON_ID=2898 /ORGANISM="Cryptomonas paramecium" /LENGTH=238 /DNA_ID=CAMNT_0000581855 /DNA_START=218 /DNA_END=931 /DNA_ORIENTATION=+ /assembly_acc=CAM_ASM_000170